MREWKIEWQKNVIVAKKLKRKQGEKNYKIGQFLPEFSENYYLKNWRRKFVFKLIFLPIATFYYIYWNKILNFVIQDLSFKICGKYSETCKKI